MEKEKIEELLKPRYKVIADYPDSGFEVGSIEDRDWCRYENGEDESEGILWRISDYPHLFKKLEWWEERKIEELPKFVKRFAEKGIFKIHHWNETLTLGWSEDHCRDIRYDECLPATEAEYNEFITSKNISHE